MNKNLLPNHFDTAGVYLEGERSQFNFRKPHKATFMSGMLVPYGDPIPVFPGVKLDLKHSEDIRSNTMVVPPLDPIFIDFFTVWVPHRIVWNHHAQFLGDNDTTAWTQSLDLVYPYVELNAFNSDLLTMLNTYASQFDITAGNLFLAPHYGLFYGVDITGKPSASKHINILAMRGYYACWNYYFRDENYQRPVLWDKGDTGDAGEYGYFLRNYRIAPNSDDPDDPVGIVDALNVYESDVEIGTGLGASYACLMPVNKLHDAFTSVLPQAQFGDPVEFSFVEDPVPVMASLDNFHQMGDIIRFGQDGNKLNSQKLLGVYSGGGLGADQVAVGGVSTLINSSNMVVDLSSATAITVNQWRTSVMYQRYLEALARGGRRPVEYYDVIYGVKNSVVRKDYPVLMSRSRYVLGVNQVVATADSSGEDWTSHLGDTGAYSLTRLRGSFMCEHDFDEFGYLHTFYCIRAENLYSQMIQPHFLRSTLLDEYNPFFDHIGDVDLPNYIVNVLANIAGNFGFQEAWWDERTELGMAVGGLNKLYGSLKFWIVSELFDENLVTCTPSYLTFNPDVFEDLFVSSLCVYPQFILDGMIYGVKSARMSPHSIPGITGRI